MRRNGTRSRSRARELPITRKCHQPIHTAVTSAAIYPRDYKSYTEVGIAEIEIELNNGDLTTNNEFFHNEAFSGSHRSLPLPSILEVTNLENGRIAKVRVNNRGAYSSTHIINLSSGVFKELNLNSGGALVKIELINTNESFILSETRTFEEEKKIVEAPISDVVVIDSEISNSNTNFLVSGFGVSTTFIIITFFNNS